MGCCDTNCLMVFKLIDLYRTPVGVSIKAFYVIGQGYSLILGDGAFRLGWVCTNYFPDICLLTSNIIVRIFKITKINICQLTMCY